MTRMQNYKVSVTLLQALSHIRLFLVYVLLIG